MGPFETECKERAVKIRKALYGTPPQAPLTPLPKVVPPPPGEPYQKTRPRHKTRRVASLEAIKREADARRRRADELVAELESMQLNVGPAMGHRIARAVAKAHGIDWQDFISKRRWKHVVQARQHAMWEIRKNTTLSLPSIARILGGFDHTTILWGLRKHQQRIDSGEFPHE